MFSHKINNLGFHFSTVSKSTLLKTDRITWNSKCQHATGVNFTRSGSRQLGDNESISSMRTEIAEFLRMDEEFEQYPGTEREQYDFASERHNYFTTSLAGSTAHMIKGCLGVGILNIHEAYMYGGLWTSLAVTALLGFMAPYNTLLLVRKAQSMYVKLRIPRMSYPDLLEATVATGPIEGLRQYSRFFRYVMDIVLFAELCSACAIYQIMMAVTIKRVLEKVIDDDNLKQPLRVYLLFLALPLSLLCIIRKLKFLAPFSMIADVFVVACVTTSLAYSFPPEVHISQRAGWKSVQGMFRFSGIFLYSIDGMTLALPIENNMTKPKLFPSVVVYALPTVIVCVTVVGFYGYWEWGEHCTSPITLHLPMNLGTIILQFCLVIVLAVTFAIDFWVPFRIVWRFFTKRFPTRKGLWERVLRCLFVLIITLFSLITPNLCKFISVIGNVLFSVITFMVPGFMDFLITLDKNRTTSNTIRLARAGLNIIVGLILFCGGLYSFMYPDFYQKLS